MRAAVSATASSTGLQISWRAGDYTQKLAGRGLLLKRLGKVVRALAELIEQTCVLDGDDGLVGKIGYQLDLLLGERAYLGAIDGDPSDDLTLLEHRHIEHCPNAAQVRRRHADRIALSIRRLGSHVGNVHRLLGPHGAAKPRSRSRMDQLAQPGS